MKNNSWKCSHCGYQDFWFDRTITTSTNENETMYYRCNKCGKDISNEIYNTNVEVKSENFSKFVDLIANQFKHGGNKYSIPGFLDREATDIISSCFGGESQLDWILGTIMKYLFRFKNFQREKDLFKIATYCYILWLKIGGHIKENHDEDIKK